MNCCSSDFGLKVLQLMIYSLFVSFCEEKQFKHKFRVTILCLRFTPFNILQYIIQLTTELLI